MGKVKRILEGIALFAAGVFVGLVIPAISPAVLSEEQIPYAALLAGIVAIYAFACLKFRGRQF